MSRARSLVERLDSPLGVHFLMLAILVPPYVVIHDVFSPDVFHPTWATVGFVIGVLLIGPHYFETGRRIERRIYESLRLRIAIVGLVFAVAAGVFWLLDFLNVTLGVGAYLTIPGIAAGSVVAELLRRSLPRYTAR